MRRNGLTMVNRANKKFDLVILQEKKKRILLIVEKIIQM
jgi:hypothetical protein